MIPHDPEDQPPEGNAPHLDFEALEASPAAVERIVDRALSGERRRRNAVPALVTVAVAALVLLAVALSSRAPGDGRSVDRAGDVLAAGDGRPATAEQPQFTISNRSGPILVMEGDRVTAVIHAAPRTTSAPSRR